MTTGFNGKGRKDPSTTISGRFDGVPMMALSLYQQYHIPLTHGVGGNRKR